MRSGGKQDVNFDDLVRQRFRGTGGVEGEELKEQRSLRDLETILHVVRKINTSLVLSDVLELVTDEAIRIARAERGFVMLASPDGKLEFVVGRNNKGESIKAQSFEVSSTVLDDVHETGESLCIESAMSDERFENRQSIMNLELQTIICAPLRTQDERIGLLYVDSRSIQAIDKADILFGFEILAGHAAIAIKNARLYADLKHTYEELKQANLHIIHYERMAMKGEIAAEISHELKNLVAVVLLSLQRLQSKINSITPDELSRVIETIVGGVKKIEGFSKNLLTRSRVASRFVPLSLNKIVTDFVDFMRFLPRFKTTSITVSLATNFPVLNLDIDQMQQVLLNLMNNIVEAKPDASIELRTEYLAEISEARLSVSDNGPGIEDTIKDKLFAERVTTKDGGHGYGLSVCKQIMESHGGTIRFESTRGRGTRFILSFPVAAG